MEALREHKRRLLPRVVEMYQVGILARLEADLRYKARVVVTHLQMMGLRKLPLAMGGPVVVDHMLRHTLLEVQETPQAQVLRKVIMADLELQARRIMVVQAAAVPVLLGRMAPTMVAVMAETGHHLQ